MNKKSKQRNGKLNKDSMKKDIQITTEVLEVRRDEMKTRTMLMSEAVHNRLTTSVKQWIETGVTNKDLLEYELE